MGGLTILPDCTIDKVMIDKSNMLIMPGTARVTDSYSKRGKSHAMTGKQRGGVRDDEKMV